jgi:hypothetical protein
MQKTRANYIDYSNLEKYSKNLWFYMLNESPCPFIMQFPVWQIAMRGVCINSADRIAPMQKECENLLNIASW